MILLHGMICSDPTATPSHLNLINIFCVQVCGENTRWDGAGAGGAATVRGSNSVQPTESLRVEEEWAERRNSGARGSRPHGCEDSKSYGPPCHCHQLFWSEEGGGPRPSRCRRLPGQLRHNSYAGSCRFPRLHHRHRPCLSPTRTVSLIAKARRQVDSYGCYQYSSAVCHPHGYARWAPYFFSGFLISLL